MKKSAITFLMTLIASVLFAQTLTPGVLEKRLRGNIHDTVRVNILYTLSKYYWNHNSDSALFWADSSLNFARKIDFKKGVALSYLTKGVSLVGVGEYTAAMECHLHALELSEELHLPELTGNNYNNIGIVYSQLGDFAKAQEYYEKSLDIMKQYGVAATLSSLINIGDNFAQAGQFTKAQEYNFKALKLSHDSHDQYLKSNILFNIGDVYYKTGDDTKAMTYLDQSLTISTSINDTEGMALCYQDLAQIYKNRKDYIKSAALAQQALRYSFSLGNREFLRDNYNLLFQVYQKSGDVKRALDYKILETAIDDSLFMNQKNVEVGKFQLKYELEKKQRQIDLLNKDNLIQEQEIEKKRFQRNTFVVGVIGLSFLATVLIFYTYSVSKKNKTLNRQNSEIVQQKNIIVQQNNELEQLNAQKSRILSVITHDIRSPLNSLSSFIQLLDKDWLSAEDAKKIVMLLQEEFNNTNSTLENLLFWAKCELQGYPTNIESFDLKVVVSAIIKSVALRSEGKNLALKNEIPERMLIKADVSIITIVIQNLISNAIKFSNPDGSIMITGLLKNGFVEIAVRDNGVGIPEKDHHKIFKYKSNFTTKGTGNEKGTGLGLALCNDFIERLGGKMWFESKPGIGSTFFFSVPMV